MHKCGLIKKVNLQNSKKSESEIAIMKATNMQLKYKLPQQK